MCDADRAGPDGRRAAPGLRRGAAPAPVAGGKPRPRRAALAALALSAAAASAAPADDRSCPTASTGASCGGALGSGEGGAKRILVAPDPPRIAPGDVLPRGRYSLLLNSEYYGLPRSDGSWRYYRVQGRVLRVRPDSLEVIEDVTAKANAAF